jgi:hypothetical protein
MHRSMLVEKNLSRLKDLRWISPHEFSLRMIIFVLLSEMILLISDSFWIDGNTLGTIRTSLASVKYFSEIYS